MTTATNTSLGEIKLAGDLAGNNNGLAPELSATTVVAGSYTIPVITVDAKGRISGASTGTSATITALIPDATSSVKGIASINTSQGLSISSGQISAVDATTSVKGIAKFNSNFIVTAGSVAINPAGLIATGSVFGVVKSGTNITNTAGVLSIPDATTSVKGIASFNAANFTVTAGDVALTPGSLPLATGSTAGVVITGTNITNTAGTISVPDATSSVKGIASFGAGFSVTSGAVTINYGTVTANLTQATGSVFGVVKSGTNITNTAGVLSVPDATTSVKGIASFNAANFTVTAGAVSLLGTIPVTNAQNIWTKAQGYTISALTYGAAITPDFSQSNVFSLTAAGNFTLMNPTNVVAGTTYLIVITQDATGSRLITWGSNFKFGAGAVTALSTAANKRDIISVVALSSTVLLVTTQLGF